MGRRRSARAVLPRPLAASLLGLVLATGLLAACEDQPSRQPREERTSQTPSGISEVSFGVFGDDAEVRAYRRAVAAYNADAVTVRVRLQAWPNSAAMIADFERGTPRPDLFLTTRRDLEEVVTNEWNTSVFGLLEERDVAYGDDYAQDALDAFSADDDLQCMPYGVSPQVIYYNTDLIDFARMQARGLPAPDLDPESSRSWNFEEFSAAAQFATRRRLGTRGVSIDPTLTSLAPFLLSGGGSLFDDDTAPTSLDFSSSDNQETLAEVLALLRDPRRTLTDGQLARATPEEWFERGKLGMIEGLRSLTPRLRDVPGLHFDVMPMPSVDSGATVGEFSGLCIARGEQIQRAADFLVFLLSREGYDIVARTGYLVPANVAVARSAAFLQPGQQPAHADVFNASVSAMELLPLGVDYEALDDAVDPALTDLLQAPVLDDLPAATANIDELSRPVLDPSYAPPSTPASPASPPSPSGAASPGSARD